MAAVEADLTPRPPNAKVIAFAFSVVHSKPADLSVGEYIRLLRLHVAKGSRAGAVSSTYHHLDRSAYWRAESERMKDALKSAEDEAVDLRRELVTVKARLEAARLSNPTKKRKKNDEETIPYPRSPKKSKQDASSSRSGALSTFDSSVIEAELSQAGEVGNILLRSLFHIHAILKSHHKIEPSVLAHHLVRASSAIPQVVLAEIQKYIAADLESSDSLKKTLQLARRAVTSIVSGFNRLSHVAEGHCEEGRAVYAVVQMWKQLLAGVAQLSEAEGRRMLAAEAASRKAAAEKAKAKGKPPRALNIKENPTLSLYTAFLNNILDLLDSKDQANHALFEGFAFCILESLGGRLYHSVFGHARGRTLEAEILQSNASNDTGDDEPISSSPPGDDQKQINLEAPYLIALLDRIMAAAPSYLGAAVNAKTGKPKHAHNRATMKGALAVEAKERLQRTLVTCMFGDSEGMESDPFAESLKMPAPGNESISMPKVKEPEVQEWFKEEMWRLLGWEILSKEGEW